MAQASYLIDYIPTAPVKGKEPPAPPAAPPTPGNPPPAAPGGNVPAKLPTMPSAPPKPVTLRDDEINARIESLSAQPDVAALETAWNTILEEKKKGLLGGSFFKLHQAYIRTKASLKSS